MKEWSDCCGDVESGESEDGRFRGSGRQHRRRWKGEKEKKTLSKSSCEREKKRRPGLTCSSNAKQNGRRKTRVSLEVDRYLFSPLLPLLDQTYLGNLLLASLSRPEIVPSSLLFSPYTFLNPKGERVDLLVLLVVGDVVLDALDLDLVDLAPFDL